MTRRQDLEPRRRELMATIAWQRTQLGAQVQLLKHRLSSQGVVGAVRRHPVSWALAGVATVAAVMVLPRVVGWRVTSLVQAARTGARWWMLGRLAWKFTSQWRRPAATSATTRAR